MPTAAPRLYTAEWNDDFHNAAHVVATGETEGYYRDFADDRWAQLARALAEGFVYQGEPSPHRGERRAASRAPTCRRPPSSISCRTTTRSATAPSASG